MSTSTKGHLAGTASQSAATGNSASKSAGTGAVRDVLRYFKVVSGFDVPRWQYEPSTRTFLKASSPATLMGTPDQKATMYRDRYRLIKQHLLRHPFFRATNSEGKTVRLPPIKTRLGQEGEKFVFFGMLSQLKEGKWFLEDLDDRVELDLSEAELKMGLFTETCFVLVDGLYMDDARLKVSQIAMPPCEAKDTSQYPLFSRFLFDFSLC